MPTYCDLAEEAAALGDSIVSAPSTNLEEGAALGGVLLSTLVTMMVEAAALGDGYTDLASFLIVESAVIGDAITQSVSAENDVVESAVLGDALATVMSNDVVESAVLNDALSVVSFATMVEAALLGDAFSGAQTLANNAVEAAVLDDGARVQALALLVEAAILGDACLDRQTLANTSVEAATIGDAATASSTVTSNAIETAELGDAQTNTLTGVNDAVESATLDDALWAAGGGVAWRAHLEPMAMSRYTEYAFTSMAVVDGVLLATGADGIYALASTDAPVPVDAEIRHDWTDAVIGRDGKPSPNPQLKRPTYAYFSHRGGGIVFALGYVEDGVEGEFHDELPAQTAQQFTNGRVKLGRGIRSRYLRPVVKNKDGGHFELNDGRVVVDSLARSL